MNSGNHGPHDELPLQHSSFGFTGVLVVVAILTVFFAVLMRSNTPPGGSGHPESPQVSTPFPPLEAVGWLNGSAPTPEELSQNVKVIDAWAFWCGPCRAAIPTLVQIDKKYKGQGVLVIGMTAEGGDASSLKQTTSAIESMKIPYLNAYGAYKPMQTLAVNSIPQLWVVDRNNKIVFHEVGWSPQSPADIEAAVEKALKTPAASAN